MDRLKRLFEQHYGFPPQEVKQLQGQLGGSGRAIVRLSGQRMGAIGVVGPDRAENIAFLEFSKHFYSHGMPVPEIYAEDLDRGAYLEEDLGDTTLYEFLGEHRSGESIDAQAVDAYRKVVAVLPRFQVVAGRDLNYKVCYPRSSFDRQSIAWDLNYFKYYFLRLAGVPFNEQSLEYDFGRLTKFLLTADRDYFLYRDFQSRNVMLRGGEPFFLDYQGGRKGALQYDIASLLYDGKADLPPAVRQQLLDHYLDCLAELIDLKRDAFMEHYYAYVYVRILQALGAYGFRGFYERKAHFLQSVPYALKNLRWLAESVKLPIALPALLEALEAIAGSEKLQQLTAPSTAGLTVRVFSFSFHQSAPIDETGNGGGFVFDARALPNPGREERFRALTGRDDAVIDYLSREQSVSTFLAHAIALVDASVASYRRRGFSSLMVSFGCTGGQHRSVYMAEQLAKHLCGADGMQVVLRHVELEKKHLSGEAALENVKSGEPKVMKAMVLAAGVGTRLRPLTSDRPKALVTIGGHTMLEITLARLRRFGVTEAIVNTHHYGEMIREYLKANGNFGMRIEISHEEELLDTGGGLKKAGWFFLDGKDARGAGDAPFILHNVDAISTIDMACMAQFHAQQGALATLAVQDRETKRYLLFDAQNMLCGRQAGRDGEQTLVRASPDARAFAFCGIHILSSRIFAKMTEVGAFSIIDAYLHLAALGEKIAGFRSDEYRWRDLGRPEAVAKTAEDIENGMFPAH